MTTSRQRVVLLIAVLASLVAFLDASVVNVALPAIDRELGGGLVLQQWVVDAYLITLGSLILVAGSLSDLLSRKGVLWSGLIGFGVTSLLCAFAPSGEILILGRALQGAAGALLVPSSLALIVAAFDGAEQAKAIGRWTGWTSVAFLLGPVLGGIFVDTLSWRWVFAINVIPIAVTCVLLGRLGGETERRRARIDIPGAVLGALALAALVFALIEADASGWGSPLVIASAVLGVVAAVLFVVVERRSAAPMLPFSIFGARDFAAGNLATAFVYAALSLGPLVVALYLQQVAGLAATLAGLAFLPATVISTLLAGRFGALAGRFGSRWFMTAGPVVAAGGYLWMLLISPDFDYWWQLLPGVILFGLGLSTTVAPLTAAILGAVPQQQAGIGSAINNAVARVAGLIAVACVGLIVGERLDLGGLHRSLLVTAVLLLLGAGVSALGIRDTRLARRG